MVQQAEMSLFSMSQSRKRTSESDSSKADEPLSKRIRLEPQSPKSVSSLNKSPNSNNSPTMFDDGPHKLLLRSVSIALQHVGFNSATPEALEAFCQEVETYALHLLSKVTVSMLSSRRSQPIPNDFQYALSEFDIPLLSIEPHLRPPVPASKLSIQLELLPAEELPALTNAALFGDELSGEADKNNKIYIPKKFPSFPSKHTYKWTEKDSGRDLDPRKIREEAAKAAREGEEALRRLTKVGKAANEKNAKKTASRDPRSKERHEIWENVMDNLLSGGSSINSPMENANNEIESTSMIVNAERPHFRKGPSGRRNSPLSTDPFDSIRILITLRSKFPCGYSAPGLPPDLSSLYHAHSLKGPLAIKCIPTTAAATALINHILEYQLTTYCGTVALLDFTGRFTVSHLSAHCGIDSLSHLHIFRPLRQSKEAFEAVKQWMLFGNHASHGKEWVGTIIIGAEIVSEWKGPEKVLVSSAWNGWLNVARDEPQKFLPRTSVEEAWNQSLNPDVCVSWRAWCEEGEYKWRKTTAGL